MSDSTEEFINAVTVRYLGTLSTSGRVGKAGNKRAGHPRSSGADARTWPWFRGAVERFGKAMCVVALLTVGVSYEKESAVEIKHTRVTAHAEVAASCFLQPSRWVARQVTKWQADAKRAIAQAYASETVA